MKNFFKKLFGIKSIENSDVQEPDHPAFHPDMEHIESIFRDDSEPKRLIDPHSDFEAAANIVAEETKNENVQNRLRDFLSKDFHGIGYRLGYNYHNKEDREYNLDEMVYEFCEIADSIIMRFKKQASNMKAELKGIEGDEDLQTQHAMLSIDLFELEGQLAKLVLEKDLAASRQGLLGKCLVRFRKGYNQGMLDYFEQKRMNTSFTLFN